MVSNIATFTVFKALSYLLSHYCHVTIEWLGSQKTISKVEICMQEVSERSALRNSICKGVKEIRLGIQKDWTVMCYNSGLSQSQKEL